MSEHAPMPAEITALGEPAAVFKPAAEITVPLPAVFGILVGIAGLVMSGFFLTHLGEPPGKYVSLTLGGVFS